MNDRTFVIAEAAGCHDGDYDKALRLVHLTRDIGADAVKFQWCSSPERLAARRRAPESLEAYRTLAFPREWFPYLRREVEMAGLELMVTAYLPEDVAVVAEYVDRFKVASFEATDVHFVALHAEWPTIPLVISAGMGADLKPSLTAYLRGRPTSDGRLVTVLACVSAYPCPDAEANLAVLWPRIHELPWRPYQGYSDHTLHPWTGALAVAAGAQVVEFHVRLDETGPDNADFGVARDPLKAAEYVRNIRQAEVLLGDGTRGVRACEAPMLRYRVGQEGAR